MRVTQPRGEKEAFPDWVRKPVTKISVSGFKSIGQEQSIEIRPLTILAGANSSGKSSMIQPLLLLKQTLEKSYDPGALLLSGPNVKFTSLDQLLSSTRTGGKLRTFAVGMTIGSEASFSLSFGRELDKEVEIRKLSFTDHKGEIHIAPGMTHEKAEAVVLSHTANFYQEVPKAREGRWIVVRNRCFLELNVELKPEPLGALSVRIAPSSAIEPHIRRLIHLPGLRGNPERTYPVSAVSETFSGTFENYTASVIAHWQVEKKHERVEQLNVDLEKLGLTWKVTAKPINDTQVELQVGRLVRPVRGCARELVNIADVGFGVSQALPVLVALQVAEPGQLVYLEQPEIHLHPRAQSAMAQILADAVARGVRVIAETHSNLLLLGIQSLVAEGRLLPDKVKLHWFSRIEDGSTRVTSADLDETGAFGDWPEDFAEVTLEAQSRYLDAAEARGWGNGHASKKVKASRY
jgi:hypothetical protein